MRTRAGVHRGGHSLAPSGGGPRAARQRPTRPCRRVLLGAGVAVMLAAAGLAAWAATGTPARQPAQATGPAPASTAATPTPSAAASTPSLPGRPSPQQAIGAIGGYQVATLTLRLTDRSRLQARPRV